MLKYFRKDNRESNSLNQDQSQGLVGSDRSPNCLQRLVELADKS